MNEQEPTQPLDEDVRDRPLDDTPSTSLGTGLGRQPPSNTPFDKAQGKKLLAGIVIVLGVLVAVGAGAYFYTHQIIVTEIHSRTEYVGALGDNGLAMYEDLLQKNGINIEGLAIVRIRGRRDTTIVQAVQLYNEIPILGTITYIFDSTGKALIRSVDKNSSDIYAYPIRYENININTEPNLSAKQAAVIAQERMKGINNFHAELSLMPLDFYGESFALVWEIIERRDNYISGTNPRAYAVSVFIDAHSGELLKFVPAGGYI